jgi:hypothetical protein
MFATQNYLNNHISSMHQDKITSPMEAEEEIEITTETQYICKICKVKRNTQNKLEKHMANHNEDGDWFCEMCAFQSIHIAELRKHMKKHSTCLTYYISRKLNATSVITNSNPKMR